MTFQRKLFTAVFVTSAVVVVVGLVSVFVITSRNLSSGYENRYRGLMQNVAEIIGEMDRTTEQTMQTALEALRLKFPGEYLPDDKALAGLSKRLNVSMIEVVAADGRFIRSSTYPLESLPNLFKLCDSYRNLFSNADYDRTPLTPSAVDGHVYKFSLMPTQSRKYVFNIGIEVTFIETLFRNLLKRDHNLVSIGLFSPSGQSLGQFYRESSVSIAASERVLDVPGELARGVIRYSDRIEIPVKMAATLQQCCECVAKGQIQKVGDEFFYVLKATVSLQDLSLSIQKLRVVLALLFCALLVVSFVVAAMVSRTFARRIDKLKTATDNLSDSPDLAQRINMPAGDEIATIAAQFDKLLDSLHDAQKSVIAREKDSALAGIAQQVAHNIKTPVLALEGVDTSGLDDVNRANYRSAVEDIKDMVNNLRAQAKALPKAKDEGALEAICALGGRNETDKGSTVSNEMVTLEHLMGLIEMSVSQVRLNYKGPYEIDFQVGSGGYGLFAAIQKTELKSIICNLINNSLEALDGAGCAVGRVDVSIEASGNAARIAVRDNGPGIAKEILPKVGERGFTYGKKKGSGLGLYHANQAVQAWGGWVYVESPPGGGALVTVEIPSVSAPEWFVTELRLPKGGEIAVLDDSTMMEHVWRSRLKASGLADYPMSYFEKGDDFVRWYNGREDRDLLCLVDYELAGQVRNGLDIIEALGISERSVLVTGRADDPKVQAKAKWVGVKILPKGILGYVAIAVQ